MVINGIHFCQVSNHWQFIKTILNWGQMWFNLNGGLNIEIGQHHYIEWTEMHSHKNTVINIVCLYCTWIVLNYTMLLIMKCRPSENWNWFKEVRTHQNAIKLLQICIIICIWNNHPFATNLTIASHNCLNMHRTNHVGYKSWK